jgi:hypothetical protein
LPLVLRRRETWSPISREEPQEQGSPVIIPGIGFVKLIYILLHDISIVHICIIHVLGVF